MVLNDPYQGGTHTPDVTMTMPVFHEGELLGYRASAARTGPTSAATSDTHIGGEGLRLPPLMLSAPACSTRSSSSIIKNCTRTPQYVEGDIQAQIGALRAAETR